METYRVAKEIATYRSTKKEITTNWWKKFLCSIKLSHQWVSLTDEDYSDLYRANKRFYKITVLESIVYTNKIIHQCSCCGQYQWMITDLYLSKE